MMKTMKFEITGMTCSACAQHVEKAVNKLDGIKTANVNLLTNRLTVEADPSVIGAEDIVAAVEKSGYGAFHVDEEVERASLNIQPASDCRGACPIKITTMKFDITGMTCSACAQHVEKAVNKLDGIKTANVNLLTNRLTVEADTSVIGAEDIIAAVEKSGYGAAVSDETTAVGLPGENQNTACSTGGCPIAFNEKSGSGVVNPNKRNPKSQKNGLSAERKKRADEMKTRLIVSLVFMVVLMYVAMGHMFGAPLPNFLTGPQNGVSYALLQLLLALPIIYVNRAYYINGFKRLFRGAPNMDTLVAVGSSASLVYGIYAIFRMSWGLGQGDLALVEGYTHQLYFESAGMILALVTVGKYLETLSKRRTGDALDKLKKLAPDTAIVLRNGVETEIATAYLAVGDVVIIKAGTSVPADGIVEEGSGFADEAAISGESMPVEKLPGANVIGGTILKSGYLKVRLNAVGKESMLQKIIALVEDAGAKKAPIQRLADKISGVFVPVVMSIAAVTFIGWAWGTGNIDSAINAAVAVLVISCPCALGLATPVAVTVGTGKGAENGILIKDGEALEKLHAVKYVVLDKTGTVTKGEPEVAYVSLSDEDLNAVGALEKMSEHPLGAAVVAFVESKNFAEKIVFSEFETLPGKGVRGKADTGSVYSVGNAKLMEEEGVDRKAFESEYERVTGEGKTPLLVCRDSAYVGLIATSDAVKEDSKEAVSLLKKMGITTVMLTGDNRRTAAAVAKAVGVDEVIAEVLPADKAAKVAELRSRGKVAMVGDGINDAPALKEADVGIAIGSGADIAVDSADVVLIKNALIDVVNAIKLSSATLKNIKENLFWAFFYNVLGIPIAAGVLYVPFGIMLSPMIGALAMSCSSLFVVGNALRLKFFKTVRFKGGSENSLSVGQDLSSSEQSGETDAPGVTSAPVTNIETDAENDYKNSETSENTTINTFENQIQTERSLNMKQYKLSIEGMSCMHCVGRVEKAISAVPGVSKAEVSLENKSAVVTGGEPEALKAAVVDAGYEVSEIKEI